MFKCALDHLKGFNKLKKLITGIKVFDLLDIENPPSGDYCKANLDNFFGIKQINLIDK